MSRSWRHAAQQLLAQPVLRISSLVDGVVACARTNDRVFGQLLTSSAWLTELHLHGLTSISDNALRSLIDHPLRVASLTYCTSLTAAMVKSLPKTVVDLRIAGCHNLYAELPRLSRLYTLDVHVCAAAEREVERQAHGGFRFVDPALRMGIRMGVRAACTCGAEQCEACEPIPDVRGVVRAPEIWHASSFDWLETKSLLLS